MYRQWFLYPDTPYFLSHSVGLAPKSAEDAFNAGFLTAWQSGEPDVWDGWLSTIEQFRKEIAGLIGGRTADVCPQTNVSSALTKLLFALPREEHRRRIVLAAQDFPTNGFVLKQAEKMGCTLDFIDGDGALADPDLWAAKLDDDVFCVHITHVFSNLGLKTPVKEITAATREAGAYAIVDAAQSAGVVPIDVADWNADAVLGTSVKYLCGGPGAAWMWADPALTAKARPIDVGWFSHEEPFAFDIKDFRYAPDATRFMGGTPSPAPFTLSANSVQTINEIGAEDIYKHSQALISRFLENWPADRAISHAVEGERGAGIVIRPPNIESAVNALTKEGIGFDQRSGGIRLSFHLYNDESDVALLLKCLNA